MGVSASLLAQVFSLLVRQVAEVLEGAWQLVHSPTPPYVLPMGEEDPVNLSEFVWNELNGVWTWLVGALDVVECQLGLGEELDVPSGSK